MYTESYTLESLAQILETFNTNITQLNCINDFQIQAIEQKHLYCVSLVNSWTVFWIDIRSNIYFKQFRPDSPHYHFLTKIERKSFLSAWSIECCWKSCSRIFRSYDDVTVDGEGQENLDPCSAPTAFRQRGTFIVPQMLWHGTSVFAVSFKAPFTTTKDYMGLF